MGQKYFRALFPLFLAAAAGSNATAQTCPSYLTPEFPVWQLHQCPALYKKLCYSVCGPRYDESEVRGAAQLQAGEKAVLCVDFSMAMEKNGVSYASDRTRHKCFDGAQRHSAGGGTRSWCLQYNYTYKRRKLGAYLQCASRLDNSYVPGAERRDDGPRVVTLLNTPEPARSPRTGTEPTSAGDDIDPTPSYIKYYGRPVGYQNSPVSAPEPAVSGAAAAAPRVSENIEDTGANPFEKLINRSKMGDGLAQLAQLRSAIKAYYARNGHFPLDLHALVPDFISGIPTLEIPGYSKSFNVLMVTRLGDRDRSEYVRDRGGWIYVYDTGSKNHGAIFFNSRKRFRNKPLYNY
ncbi:MAG TPA: hypothetical protein DCZ92_07225 [Elusimicrobia bacterium]|nr:MAG: hypothetical protein A2016_02780 [Elusimicrobia bacterium GWF2_62_30]HBA60597.1 hypothetical protein [Elusimicrobiota bacterium]